MKPGRAAEPDNEKRQVSGLRARAKELLADSAPLREGGGRGRRYQVSAKTGKVLFRLRSRAVRRVTAPTHARTEVKN